MLFCALETSSLVSSAHFQGMTDPRVQSWLQFASSLEGVHVQSQSLLSLMQQMSSKQQQLSWGGFGLLRFQIASLTTPSLNGRSVRFKKGFVHLSLRPVSLFVLSYGQLHVVMVPLQ